MLTVLINAIVKALTLGAFNFADGQIVRRKIEQGAVAKSELENINAVLDKVDAAAAHVVEHGRDDDRLRVDPRHRPIAGGDELL
jgi:hypothetical protein